MNLKLALSTATAMGLLMSAALADNNKAYITQGNGGGDNNNIASITQNSGATAGNKAGRALDPILQDGSNNEIDIDQTADSNVIGTTPSGAGGSFDQIGNYNSATILQSSNGNGVWTIEQQKAATAPVSSTVRNVLSITQKDDAPGGSGNLIVSVQQQTAGAGAFGNTATVTQNGNRNTIDGLRQNNGAGQNTMTVSMTGQNNGVNGFTLGGVAAAVGNDASDLDQFGGDNNIDLTIDATDTRFSFWQNGLRNTVGSVVINGVSNEVASRQVGNDNTLNLSTIAGSFNQVGLNQNSDGNLASIGLSAISDSNEVAVKQTGVSGLTLSNTATVTVDGDVNLVDATQDGDGNIATIDITDSDGGDGNEVSVNQLSFAGPFTSGNEATVGIEGDRNWTRVQQVYGSKADVDVDGDDNDVAIDQYNQATTTVAFTGDNNFVAVNALNGAIATITVTGNDTNRGAFTAGGVTGTLAAATTSALGAPMQVGGVIQNGSSTTTLTVGGLGASDGNLFSINQSGSGNFVTGTMDGSGDNEAVVTQVGGNNGATFAQNGGSNLVAISQ